MDMYEAVTAMLESNKSDSSEDSSEDTQKLPPAKIPRISNIVKKPTFSGAARANSNRSKWKQIVAKANKWIKSAHPTTPSFAILYWETSTGRHQVVWKGPEHMRRFAEDHIVQQKFKEVALDSNLGLMQNEEEQSKTVDEPQAISLPSGDPQDYVADYLYKILPRIINPTGKYGFYGDIRNKPCWFPEGTVFKSPNNPKDESGKRIAKYTADEMRNILQAFLEKCPGLYRVASKPEDTTSVVQTPSQPTQSMESQPRSPDNPTIMEVAPESPPLFDDPNNTAEVEIGDTYNSNEAPMPLDATLDLSNEATGINESSSDALHTGLAKECDSTASLTTPNKTTVPSYKTAREGLIALRSSHMHEKSWSKFLETASTVRRRMDMMTKCIMCDTLELKTVSEIPGNLLDRRRHRTLVNAGVIPSGFYAGKATGNGDCLYNAISLSFFGSEIYYDAIRLASILHAADHFDHYVEMYKCQLKEPSVAQSFIHSVASNKQVFSGRPQDNPTIQELVEYVLKQEIYETTRIGSYSGLLQIHFAASCIKRGIQLHSQFTYDEVENNGFNSLLQPCCPAKTAHCSLHIGFVPFKSTSLGMNHYIPFYPEQQTCVDLTCSQSIEEIIEIISDKECLMGRHGMCTYMQGGTEKEENSDGWVACDRCNSWYHKQCLGIGFRFGKSIPFICCGDDDSSIQQQFQIDKNVLSMADVKTLYPQYGVCDAIIDYYVRVMIPKTSYKLLHVVSSITYHAIKNALFTNKGERRPPEVAKLGLLRAHTNVTGKAPLCDSKFVAFPCKPREGGWHWIIVLVDQVECVAYVFDSTLSGTSVPQHCLNTVEDIEEFLNTIRGSEKKLSISVQKIYQQQNGVDCGIHVMHNLEEIAKNPTQQSFDYLKKQFDPIKIRSKILFQLYIATRKMNLSRMKPTTKDSEIHKLIQDSLVEEKGIEEQIIDTTKGRGVVATREFRRGEYVTTYQGEIITSVEALKREKQYEKDPTIGSFLFFFSQGHSKLCIDATIEDGTLGRLINHSIELANLKPRLIIVSDKPHICFFTTRKIFTGEELLYNYSDCRRDVLRSLQWLKK